MPFGSTFVKSIYIRLNYEKDINKKVLRANRYIYSYVYDKISLFNRNSGYLLLIDSCTYWSNISLGMDRLWYDIEEWHLPPCTHQQFSVQLQLLVYLQLKSIYWFIMIYTIFEGWWTHKNLYSLQSLHVFSSTTTDTFRSSSITSLNSRYISRSLRYALLTFPLTFTPQILFTLFILYVLKLPNYFYLYNFYFYQECLKLMIRFKK